MTADNPDLSSFDQDSTISGFAGQAHTTPPDIDASQPENISGVEAPSQQSDFQQAARRQEVEQREREEARRRREAALAETAAHAAAPQMMHGPDSHPRKGAWIKCPPGNKEIRDDGGSFYIPPGGASMEQIQMIAKLGAERGWTQFAAFNNFGNADRRMTQALAQCGLNCHPEPESVGSLKHWHAAGMKSWGNVHAARTARASASAPATPEFS